MPARKPGSGPLGGFLFGDRPLVLTLVGSFLNQSATRPDLAPEGGLQGHSSPDCCPLKDRSYGWSRPLNHPAARINVGSAEHWVAVPPGSDPEPVRCFGSITADLHRLADWLAACGVKPVGIESTGVYWIGLFQVLESPRLGRATRRCSPRQEPAREQKRSSGLPMAAEAANLWTAQPLLSPHRRSLCAAHLLFF